MFKPFLIAVGVLLVTGMALGQNATPETATNLFESPDTLSPATPIDKLVIGRLKQQDAEPPHLCSDAVFVRRVFLDTIGTLPTAREAKEFLLDRNPDKRRVLIDRLLQREEFADYWAMKWSDLLRVKAEFPINLWPNAAQAYHRWIRTSIKENKPYDRFVRELLTASGSNFREPEANFYRTISGRQPQAIARAVALIFMGARTENWPPKRLAGMAAFFAKIGYKATGEWKEEIVFFNPANPVAAGVAKTAAFPDGSPVKLSPDQDPRVVFANWLITPKNPWFARNMVNRIWSWLLGRGIIQEPDDIRPDNPAQNPELLDWLAQQLVNSHYDLKKIYRLILNSQTYQLSSTSITAQPQEAADFSHYPLRRLEAEVLIDALCQITGTTEKYSSAIPEPYTVMPEDRRTMTLPDGSITSPFLDLFGRSPRDTGRESERNNQITGAQRLHMLNSTHIQRKLEQGRLVQSLLKSRSGPDASVTEEYLTILSRFPTPEEIQTVEKYAQTSKMKRREILVDLAWALINSSEFLYRH